MRTRQWHIGVHRWMAGRWNELLVGADGLFAGRFKVGIWPRVAVRDECEADIALGDGVARRLRSRLLPASGDWLESLRLSMRLWAAPLG